MIAVRSRIRKIFFVSPPFIENRLPGIFLIMSDRAVSIFNSVKIIFWHPKRLTREKEIIKTIAMSHDELRYRADAFGTEADRLF